MSWYAAHAVMYVKFKDGNQDRYPIWENILLIKAESDEAALAKASARAREDEGDSEGSFTWSGRPAAWCFAGIRKLIACDDPNDRPGEGTEITYLEMEVDSKENLARLMIGEPSPVQYS